MKYYLLGAVIIIGILIILPHVYGQRAVCDDYSYPNYSCMGACNCEGSGGHDGESPCSFYCITEQGLKWCGIWTSPRCFPDMPI
jgi:hypothetical protein